MDLQLKLDRAEYALGDVIRATVTVTNPGKVEAVLPTLHFTLPSVSFRLHRRAGAATPECVLSRIDLDVKVLRLGPGKSASADINLLAVEPGKHSIEAIYAPQGLVTPILQDVQAYTSNRVKFNVAAGKLHARLITEAGPITLEFFPEVAPNHVMSFIELARKGFYNGVSFHRIVPGFVIQGGDPTGSGSGGPGYRLAAEFNEILHDDGILSMARTADLHTAGSQFFICLSRERTRSLDRQYTVFGRVIEGLEAVHKIGASESNAKRFHMQRVEVFTA